MELIREQTIVGAYSGRRKGAVAVLDKRDRVGALLRREDRICVRLNIPARLVGHQFTVVLREAAREPRGESARDGLRLENLPLLAGRPSGPSSNEREGKGRGALE